jgi:hypothetical protein
MLLLFIILILHILRINTILIILWIFIVYIILIILNDIHIILWNSFSLVLISFLGVIETQMTQLAWIWVAIQQHTHVQLMLKVFYLIHIISIQKSLIHKPIIFFLRWIYQILICWMVFCVEIIILHRSFKQLLYFHSTCVSKTICTLLAAENGCMNQ